MKIDLLMIIFLSLSQSSCSLLKKRTSSVTIVNRHQQRSSRDVSMLFDDRYLLDTLITKFKQKFNLKTKTPMSKKLKLMEIAAYIIKNSKKKNLKIKKVKIGKAISKLFSGNRALKLLTGYLNDKNFSIKHKLAKNKYEEMKHKRWLKNLKNQERKKMELEMQNEMAKRAQETAQAQQQQIQEEEAKKRKLEEFSYLPSFGGIPFPPVAVAGVNYHAPMDVVINTLPYPNPRAYESPYDRAKNNVENQSKLTS